MLIRTDLAVESHQNLLSSPAGRRVEGVETSTILLQGFHLDRVDVVNEQGAGALGKPIGSYLTLSLSPMLRREEESFPRAVSALSGLLREFLPPAGLVLVAGLGNRAITPDLLGPLTAQRTLVTRQLVEQIPAFADYRPVAVLTPGVLATTGVESGALVQYAVEHLHPACVIVVDALCARSVDRLCTTVQLSNTGLIPGSGVGNHRFALTQDTLGVPVLSLGVPTVVDSATLVADLVGEPEAARGHSGLFVTPQEIDSRVNDLSRVLAFAISQALNPHLTVDDLILLLE